MTGCSPRPCRWSPNSAARRATTTPKTSAPSPPMARASSSLRRAAASSIERINPTAEQGCGEAGKACTLNLTASDRTPPDPLGSRPAAFMGATPDGAASFFASPEELTHGRQYRSRSAAALAGQCRRLGRTAHDPPEHRSDRRRRHRDRCQIPLLGRHRQKHDRAGRTERR